MALHAVDLDRFKTVNDALGHDVGDSLLVSAAERLRAVAGPDDIVARLGADEFGLVQTGLDDKSDAERLAARVIDVMGKPFHLHGHQISISVSIGVAVAPADGDSPARLLKSADLALERSKLDGRNCARLFAADMDIELRSRLELEKSIRDALAAGTFELNYQPLVDVPSGGLAGFEALLRLKGPDGVYIPPTTFIPVAEQIGMIDSIGAWVLREACRTAANWPDRLTVAVNLSAAQFSAGRLADTVAKALAESGLAPRRLELEITESLLLGDTGGVHAELARLKRLGVAIAMDDFGTGFSSLSYLWRFPLDRIKIDRGFMLGYDAKDKNVETVVKTIVALGRALNMSVTVEGVENERQAEFVRQVDCDQAQGYHFGKPMPVADVAARILTDFTASKTAKRKPRGKLRVVR